MIRTAFAALLLLATPAAAQELTPEQSAQVDRIVADALASTQVPSASVAIVRDGKIVFTKAWGNQGPNVPAATPDTKYQIASISKQFTAAGLLLLEDDGKLSLDDTIGKYLPGISGGATITIRQLLSHTSGLQDYWPQDYSFAAMESRATPQAILDRWAKKPLDFAPGSQWQYSNTGYVAAGMILEKVAGEPILAFLERRLFKPLGIRPVDQDLAVGKGYPTGYRRNALGPIRPVIVPGADWMFATGELAMSAPELAKWNIARIERKLLPAEDWIEQERMIRLTDGSPANYGLGVSLSQRGDYKQVSHGGAAVGFLSQSIVIPDARLSVVALVNGDFGNAQSTIANGIVSLLLPAAKANDDEAWRTKLARDFYAALQKGEPDRSLLTENAAYYFNAETVRDYRDSLGPLGAPTSIEPLGAPRLRGGFVNRNYRIVYPTRTLTLITYADPGRDGKIEEFMVTPAS
ncbi:serine hydrolase domain-containing protein [Sphingomonas sp. HF-S4]|uniref:Serine hydrolase domain-containing protein n=1 Tax=Sphingomonas agrestis TaxID=3080540 RepID=A0ABU3Y5D5_9SPHN|nr:serine hydrolase domain-containing protein [Sphingomonas sp. HF-S4]MDV3456625.1 serine hydrolase domain-containing protein [Sphingomonas sp. HF-S4]